MPKRTKKARRGSRRIKYRSRRLSKSKRPTFRSTEDQIDPMIPEINRLLKKKERIATNKKEESPLRKEETLEELISRVETLHAENVAYIGDIDTKKIQSMSVRELHKYWLRKKERAKILEDVTKLLNCYYVEPKNPWKNAIDACLKYTDLERWKGMNNEQILSATQELKVKILEEHGIKKPEDIQDIIQLDVPNFMKAVMQRSTKLKFI